MKRKYWLGLLIFGLFPLTNTPKEHIFFSETDLFRFSCEKGGEAAGQLERANPDAVMELSYFSSNQLGRRH